MAARKKAYVTLLITALAKGATVAQAAAQAGVSERRSAVGVPAGPAGGSGVQGEPGDAR